MSSSLLLLINESDGIGEHVDHFLTADLVVVDKFLGEGMHVLAVVPIESTPHSATKPGFTFGSEMKFPRPVADEPHGDKPHVTVVVGTTPIRDLLLQDGDHGVPVQLPEPALVVQHGHELGP